MQDINLIQELDLGLQMPAQEFAVPQCVQQSLPNQINFLPFDFQKQNSTQTADLPNLLDFNTDQQKFSTSSNQNGFTGLENDQGTNANICLENIGRQQIFPPTMVVKKNVSIQNNNFHHQYPFVHQSSEDLRSLTQSQSRFSNRKTDATSGKHSMGRDCMSSSFFSEGEESNFSRKNSDAVAPASYNPSVISTTSETACQKNSIKLGTSQNNQVNNRSSNQIKKPINSMVCIEDLIFQQSLYQEEEANPQPKMMRVTFPTQNNNFQDESDPNNEQVARVSLPQSQILNQGLSAIKTPSNNEQINQNIQQGDTIACNNNNNNNANILIINSMSPILQNNNNNNNTNDFADQKVQPHVLISNNLPDLLDEGSFINITENNNSSSGEQKNQNDTSPQGNSGPICDKESPNKTQSDNSEEEKKKTPMKVLRHSNGEDETSSDDPEMIKPVGFTIHIDHEENDTTSKKKRSKNAVISFKDITYKQVSYMEAWSRVKTMDLSKEKKILFLIRDRLQQNVGIITRILTACSKNASKNLQQASLVFERDQILAFSRVAFDTSDSLHVNMIYTIYCSLKNTQYCPLYGVHWLTIGFRHVNPKQNFDEAGVFGALQILAFQFCYKEYLHDVVQEIDALQKKNEEGRHQIQQVQQQQHHSSSSSSHNSQNHSNSQNSSSVNCNNHTQYPDRLRFKEINLCAVLQEISKNVLVWLEKGLLNQLINIEKSVISVINKMYFATFYIFYDKFKREQSGFLSISIAFKMTIEQVEANPTQALDMFKKKISLYYKLRD